MLVGLLCAAVAALSYGSASILQAVGIRRAGATGGGAGDLLALRRQPLYFLGLGLDGVGFVAGVVALQFLPLFLVQAVVAASVGVTAAIAAATGTPLGRPGRLALGAAAVGLVLLGASAAADVAHPLPTPWRWALLAAVLPVALLGRVAGAAGTRAAQLLALGAGLGFTIVAIAARSLVLPHPWWHLMAEPAFWAALVGGATAMVLFTLGLQAGDVTTVSAVTFTVETVVPAAVGLAVLGDRVRPGFWPLAVIGFLLAVAGAIALARYAEGPPEPSPGAAGAGRPGVTGAAGTGPRGA